MVAAAPKPDTYADHLFKWAKLCGQVAEDVSKGLLGFLPNGLNVIYDHLLKRLPLIGRFFSRRWMEQVFKLCTGITIGQGISTDVGRFIFRPLGFALGTILGLTFLGSLKKVPSYEGQVGKLLYKLAGFTVGGGLMGIILLSLLNNVFHLSWAKFSLLTLSLATLLGAGLGLLVKAIFSIAVFVVNNANAANAWKSMQKAKELNVKLVAAAKQKAKSRILIHAQDIIQQMNGPQSQQHLEEFLTKEYDLIAANICKKIERHFNYLTDRVCHGDIKALKRLQGLNPSRVAEGSGNKNAFENMLERIFNARALFKLKDDVDTAYDRWQYQFLQRRVI